MKPDRQSELEALLDELRSLPAQIEEIEGLSAGPLLNEARMDAALCVDLADAGALERYRAHPAHQPSLERLRDLAEEIVVADYEL